MDRGTSETGTRMVNVAALTYGLHTPSVRFRLRQHLSMLAEGGFRVDEYPFRIDHLKDVRGRLLSVEGPFASASRYLWGAVRSSHYLPWISSSLRADITWLFKDTALGRVPFRVPLKRPLVFDFDDAVWELNPGNWEALLRILKSADLVIAGNDYLAERIIPHTSRVEIVPTAVDTARFKPADNKSDDKRFVIGWTGSRPSLHYLEGLEPVLAPFLKQHSDAILSVIADEPPRFKDIPADRWQFERWSPKSEVQSIQRMDVGLMPLVDTELARGKCSFKMIQYMACGVPVVVSPVGMNRDVLALGSSGFSAESPEQWRDAMESIMRDRNAAYQMGQEGRRVVEQHYSADRIGNRLVELLREVASGVRP